MDAQNFIPNRGIINNKIGEISYAHSTLQSLSCLDILHETTNQKQFIQLPNNSLTKEFFCLLYNLYNIPNDYAYSNALIDYFEKMYYKNKENITSQNVLNHDPFHFLYFLLQFMHIEINNPMNPNYNISILSNQTIQNQQNDSHMFQIFSDFYSNTQNSLISDNFYNVEKHTFNCQKCGLFYFYNMKNIFRIDINRALFYRNSLPNNNGGYLTLYEMFDYYFSPHQTNCKNCKNCNNCNNLGDEAIKISVHNRVLIVNINRNSHNQNFNNDLNFDINIDMKKYINNEFGFYIYSLKSFIAFNGKYISFCFINKKWYKYIDNNGSEVQDISELYQFEPQILIYERANQNFDINQFNNNIQLNNNLNFNNNNNYNNNNNLNNNHLSNSAGAPFSRINNSSFDNNIINNNGHNCVSNKNNNIFFQNISAIKPNFQMNNFDISSKLDPTVLSLINEMGKDS